MPISRPPTIHQEIAPQLLGAVICGGASTRMGQDKAMLSVPSGGTYLSLAVDRLSRLCSEIVLAGRSSVPEDLPDQLSKPLAGPADNPHSEAFRLTAIPDIAAHQGPISGLLATVQHAVMIGATAVLVTPVDMPLLSSDDLKLLVTHFEQHPALPTIATFDHQQLEPLVAIYPTRLLDDLKKLLDSQDRSLYRWLQRIPHQCCKLPHRSSANMNSPTDLHPIELLAQQLSTVSTETVSLHQAIGRILRSPVLADRDSPAANVSAMDGYAIRLEDAQPGSDLPVLGQSRLGSTPPVCDSASGCVQVFTGSVIPAGYDLVVRREDVQEAAIDDHRVPVIRLGTIPYAQGMNIRLQGENAKSGSRVIIPGSLLHAGHIAVAANFGLASIEVAQKVRTRIIVTGDELRAVEDQVAPWQLRDSNGPTLTSLLCNEPWITVTSTLRAPDDYAQLVELIRHSMRDHDAILLTGGVSMGDFDFVPKAAVEAGAKQVFHKLPIRPGKPIFGAVGPQGQLILGLPGNPVSAAVGTVRFAKPLLRKLADCSAWIPPRPRIALSDAGSKTIPLTWFRLVQIGADGCCTLTPSQGSGDLVSMANSAGFVEIPPHETGPGPWPFWRWHD